MPRLPRVSLVAFLFVAASGCLAVAAEPPRVNVVLITADNLGYGDLGCYGNREIKTPNIDRLAGQGVRLTDFYVASPTCTVSRASLLTGRYPQRNGLTWQLRVEENRSGVGLRHSERLLPEFLKKQGYATACFGKWNIGFAPGSRPTERGFDEFLGHASGNMDYYTHVYNGQNDLYRGTEPAEVEGYSTDLFADAACQFIRRHAQRPFFVYLPFNAPHFPNPRNKAPDVPCVWQAPDEAFAAYGESPDVKDEKKRYRAVVTALDTGVGRVLRQIDESGLAESTLVIFFSDNGAFMFPGRGLEVASNGPLREGGATLYEGGIRVPCIVRWPGRIRPGTLCHELLVHMDFFAMALAAAGAPLPDDRTIDGRDPTAALAGRGPSPHETLCFRYGRWSAVRHGRYKLLRERNDAPFRLYDLASDLGETRDLAAERPDVAADLRRRFDQWLATVDESKKSDFARRLEFVGPAFPESETKRWHIWGCSPIDGPDGRVHLFCARWPLEEGHYKGWQTHSEVAHAVADRPEGPFRFVDVVLQGQGGDRWNAQAPHNPTIHKVGDRYALFYIARTKGGTPKDQRIGLLVAESLDGPWEPVGTGPILAPSDNPDDWDHDSRVGVNNPAFLLHPDGHCWLYNKAIATEGGARRMGLAVADRLEGPYRRLPQPVASTGTEIEDGYAFTTGGRFFLLTTDNHGAIKTGGGLLFASDDGRSFGRPRMGFDTLAGYPGSGVTEEPRRGVGPKLRKFERPQVLMRDGRPAYLYVTSGKNFADSRGSNNYVLRVRPEVKSN